MTCFARRAAQALVVASIGIVSIAHAAFVPLAQHRSVSIGGSITLVDSMGNDPIGLAGLALLAACRRRYANAHPSDARPQRITSA